MNNSRQETQRYWGERVEQSQRTQRMRFEAFVLYHDLNGKSLLDRRAWPELVCSGNVHLS